MTSVKARKNLRFIPKCFENKNLTLKKICFQDLQKIMDSAKHGVIYFSMGSNLKSKDIPKVIKDGLLKMFGELKQIVLWKFEEDLPNVPQNVHILKWAPQPSILSKYILTIDVAIIMKKKTG